MNTLFFLLFILQTHLAICSGVSNVGLNPLKNDEIDAMLKRACAGKIGDCAAESAAEFEMDSEVSRRVLVMERKYISYETLNRDTVPCTTPGASYYNCGTAEANRYSRGCDVITSHGGEGSQGMFCKDASSEAENINAKPPMSCFDDFRKVKSDEKHQLKWLQEHGVDVLS